MSTTSGRRGPTPSGDEADQLQAVRDELRGRGRPARVSSCNVGGDDDVRLEVGPAGDRYVELLGTWGKAPCGDRWQAVLITAESRAVWCGPPRSCPTAELTGFVEDLLSRAPDQLTGRYTRLG